MKKSEHVTDWLAEEYRNTVSVVWVIVLAGFGVDSGVLEGWQIAILTLQIPSLQYE